MNGTLKVFSLAILYHLRRWFLIENATMATNGHRSDGQETAGDQ